MSEEMKEPMQTDNDCKTEEAAASTQPNKSVSSINPDTLPNKKMAWWIKREENHMTPSAQEEVDLSRYDAWALKSQSFLLLTVDMRTAIPHLFLMC